jgi:hypothetical protein
MRLTYVVALALISCGPGGATPMPEPPALAAVDVTKLEPPQVSVATQWPLPVPFVAQPGTATPGSSVSVTNLDTVAAPVTTTAAADGSFNIVVVVSPGNEVRFQASLDKRRSAPRDVRFSPNALTKVERPICIGVNPDYALNFAADERTKRVDFTSNCATPATLQNPRFRAPAPVFELQSSLPSTLTPAGLATLDVNVSALVSGPVEDVLFVDLVLGSEIVRYPITLFASR